MEYKVGLVLSGGGGKGAYEYGVLKALDKLDISKKISGVSGTSIGALNGLMFAMNDLNSCKQVWEDGKVRREVKIYNNKNNFIQAVDKKAHSLFYKLKNRVVGKNNLMAIDNIKKQAFLSTQRLHSLIYKYLDLERIKETGCICYCCCHNVTKKQATYFRINDYLNKDDVIKICCASASIPVLFKPIEFYKEKYQDGGLSDNTPIKPLYDEGFNFIIVVRLNNYFEDVSKEFPNAKIITIYPKYGLGGFRDGTLNFYSDAIEQRIKQGEEDTLNFFSSYKKILEELRSVK